MTAAEVDEWKRQLGAAGFCGLFGLRGALAGSGLAALVFFRLAYLAGDWRFCSFQRAFFHFQ